MANVFDMFKKAAMAVPDYSDHIELTANQQFTCPSDGFLFGKVSSAGGYTQLEIAVNGVVAMLMQANNNSTGHIFIPVAKNDKILFTVSDAYAYLLWFYAVRED